MTYQSSFLWSTTWYEIFNFYNASLARFIFSSFNLHKHSATVRDTLTLENNKVIQFKLFDEKEIIKA